MKLDFRRFDLELTHPWAIARSLTAGGKHHYPVVFVELTDSAGRLGRGEAAPSSRYNEDANSVLGFLRRVDPARLSFDRIDESMAYLDQLSPADHAAKASLNLALWDGAGKMSGRPLYDSLRLGFRETRHVTSFSIGIDEPAAIRRKVEEADEFPVLKLKLGSPHDRESLSALRKAAPAKMVRVDANEAWTDKEEALRQIEWLAEDGHIEFVEQPMPAATPVDDLQWLKERSPLPLWADESYRTSADLARCGPYFDGVNVKLVKTGGISGGLEALQAARDAGLKTMLGCMIESSLLISAAAHLAELTDCLDLDGNLLIKNDPFEGVSARHGILSFATAPEKHGLRVTPRSLSVER